MSRKLRLVELSGASRTVRIAPEAVASGADGAIHLIEGEPALVAKLYHEPGKDPSRLRKIQSMLADPPDLPPIDVRGFRYIQAAWPLGWLEVARARQFAGYVMPLVDLGRATALENLLSKKTRAVMGLPESYGYRLTAAANLAALVAELHAHRHHIIDLKPVNLNVYTDTFYTALLDCDGLSVHGAAGERFPAHQYSDGYICPEALQQGLPPQDLGEAQDRFALAVILFQLLNQGLHPYQGVPAKGQAVPPTNGERVQQELYAYGRAAHPFLGPSPWSIHEYFDDETRLLFDRAFTSRLDRPSAREWRRHLKPYADRTSGKAEVCAVNPEHVRFAKGCPWCDLEDRQKQAAQAPAAGKGGGRRRRRQKGGQSPQPNRPGAAPAQTPGRPPAGGGHTRGAVSQAQGPTQTSSSTGGGHWGALAALILIVSLVYMGYTAYKSFADLHVFRKPSRPDHVTASPPVPAGAQDVDVRQDWVRVFSGRVPETFRTEHYLRIEPRQPSSDAWELISVEVTKSSGERVNGFVSGLRFVLDRPLEDYGRYKVHASLRHTPAGGPPVLTSRDWTIWASPAPRDPEPQPAQSDPRSSSTPEDGEVQSPPETDELLLELLPLQPVARESSPVKSYTREQLGLGPELGIGSRAAFSADGRFAFVGVAGYRSVSEDPQGRIIVFEYDNGEWNFVDALEPIGDGKAMFQASLAMQARRDGELMAALACRRRDLCDEIHLYERTSNGRWRGREALTTGEQGASGFAMSPDGRALSVLVDTGAVIYRMGANGRWQPSQSLYLPGARDDSFVEGPMVVFTDDGRKLFIGVPNGHSGQGAIYAFSAGHGDAEFLAEDIIPGTASRKLGQRLVTSGDGRFLAAGEWNLDAAAGNKRIHVYDLQGAGTSGSQVIVPDIDVAAIPLPRPEPGSVYGSFALDNSFTRDGFQLVSGMRSNSRARTVEVLLYRRSRGEYRPERLLTLTGAEDIDRSLLKSAAISPDGRYLLVAHSGSMPHGAHRGLTGGGVYFHSLE